MDVDESAEKPAPLKPPDAPDLASMSDEELLQHAHLRFEAQNRRHRDSSRASTNSTRSSPPKGIAIKPLCYLGDEWFCPEGSATIAIPFYLAHPRLKKLEEKMMMEVEGGTETWCLRLLRHEMGHVLNHAYLLEKDKRWQKLFGPTVARIFRKLSRAAL